MEIFIFLATAVTVAVLLALTCKATSSQKQPSGIGNDSTEASPYANFALSLLRAASTDANFACSPASIGITLAALLDGAAGNTRQEILALFGHNSTVETVRTIFTTIFSTMRSSSHSLSAHMANALFVDKTATIQNKYCKSIHKAYGASIKSLDFSDGVGSANIINSFIDESTKGQIKGTMTNDDFKHDLNMILINATYFQGKWSTPFEKYGTNESKFYGLGGERMVEMMYREFEFDSSSTYYSTDKVTAISLPYKDDNFSFLAVMPAGNFNKWLGSLKASKLQEIIGHLETRNGAKIYFPKFNIDCRMNCMEALMKLGVKTPFDIKNADLSGISPEPLYVGDYKQACKITVDEEGTVAVAVTECNIIVRCIPPSLRFDKPFLYAVMSGESMLFLGKFV